jgi:general secretion pathway protein A
MYLSHYGLAEPPFAITPDPRFVFLSERHRDALAHLMYGIGQGGSGGFVQLTGEVGTGKTTLCRLVLEQLPENVRVALVLNPKQTPLELLETVCEELHIEAPGKRRSLKMQIDSLNEYLLQAYAQDLRVVLIIDEAQELSRELLEQIRLLTNLETSTQKLLQIVLLGQPELRETLARPALRQLSQRITARYHLTPLQVQETGAYLRHRINIAGASVFPFEEAAVRRLHALSGGVPRLLNVLGERALLAGYVHGRNRIDTRMVDLAAKEVLPEPSPDGGAWRVLGWCLVLGGVALLWLALAAQGVG